MTRMKLRVDTKQEGRNTEILIFRSEPSYGSISTFPDVRLPLSLVMSTVWLFL